VAKPSRRDFLKIGASAVGSAALARLLAACGRMVPTTAAPAIPPVASNARVGGGTATGTSITAPTRGATAVAPSNLPDIAVARNGGPEDLVRRAVAALGGMGTFVAKGANVIVKPNICVAYHTYEYAATTNPWVVGTLVRMCFEAGASSVKVMDQPFGGTQEAAYEISGIKEQVEAAGGTMVRMPDFKYAATKIPGAVRLQEVDLFEDILKADAIINVPIAKVHGLSRLTLGMKNLMGVVRDRPVLHGHLSQNLADLTTLIKPRLTVVDAVRMLVSNGPTGGSLDDVKTLNTLVASADIVAADSYAATLFGLQPESLGYVAAATAMGLGRSDLQNMRIEEIQVGTS
jgi:uncharacterized protein (DUF362 family)